MVNENLEKLRHSLSHIMALAVKKNWPNVKFGIGPSIDNGFYYDFDFGQKKIVSEDLVKIGKEMEKIIKENLKFKKFELNIDDAINQEKKENQSYKIDLIEELKNNGEKKVSYYELGNFKDLCRGPHLKSTGEIKKESFVVAKLAGAYWRGSEKNKMITRIYGFAFETKKELEDYLELLEEAKKRDHRKIGKELDLFSISEKVGQGLILWHPKLSKTREVLETWWRKIHRENEYDYIYTPHIGRAVLWQESGHLDFFKESMYPPFIDKETKEEHYIKPMSCPFHVEIYKTKKRSYRDLPLRWNELGTCYRYEKSGELHGLARPRGFTQDDAHIICTKEQFKEEYRKVVELTLKVFNCFDFKKFKYYLAVRDYQEKDKYVGDSEVWDIAESTIKEILNEKKIKYEVEEGGAKFYGPALDIKIFDTIGREWQCPTIQLDMNLPSKFGMTYTAIDGSDQTPIMLHRTIFGSLERFCTILIEHYAGSFPFWISPVQVKIISVSEKQNDSCINLKQDLLKLDFRIETDINNETVGNKIRKGIQEKIPYLVVIGDKELKLNKLSIRERGTDKIKEMTKQDFIAEMEENLKISKI